MQPFNLNAFLDNHERFHRDLKRAGYYIPPAHSWAEKHESRRGQDRDTKGAMTAHRPE